MCIQCILIMLTPSSSALSHAHAVITGPRADNKCLWSAQPLTGHLHHIPPTRRRDHHGTEGRKLSEPEAVEDQTATASSEHDRTTSAPDLTTTVVACMTDTCARSSRSTFQHGWGVPQEPLSTAEELWTVDDFLGREGQF